MYKLETVHPGATIWGFKTSELVKQNQDTLIEQSQKSHHKNSSGLESGEM